jgi:hypothetical protein
MGSTTLNTCANFGQDSFSICVEIIDHYKRPLVSLFQDILQRLTCRIRRNCRSLFLIFKAHDDVVRQEAFNRSIPCLRLASQDRHEFIRKINRELRHGSSLPCRRHSSTIFCSVTTGRSSSKWLRQKRPQGLQKLTPAPNEKELRPPFELGARPLQRSIAS